MESVSQKNEQSGQPAQAIDGARPNLAQLRAERDGLVQRLRDLDRTITVLQASAERTEAGNETFAAQLQRIDQELRAIDGARSGGGKNSYDGVERRTTPRPATITLPLAALSARLDDGPPVRGAGLERARRMLQASKDHRL
jgi:hypothetical protein